MTSKLTEQNYWTKVQGQANLKLSDDNLIKVWIENNLDLSKFKSAIEIGCFPGRFLTIFGDKGIEVNGLDYISEVESLKNIFLKDGYSAGDFIKADFTTYIPKKKYSIVSSFGLVEHFTNWEDIFEKHFDFIEDNGYLIIEAPNFRGFFQWLPRYFFDKENFDRHNLKAMNLEKWKKILLENNFEIISAEYFGGYELWFESSNKSNIYLKSRNLVCKVLNKVRLIIYGRNSENASISCVLGIIAKKRNTLN